MDAYDWPVHHRWDALICLILKIISPKSRERDDNRSGRDHTKENKQKSNKFNFMQQTDTNQKKEE